MNTSGPVPFPQTNAPRSITEPKIEITTINTTPPDATVTPRTDAAVIRRFKTWENCALDNNYVEADFVRTLERELTSAQAALAVKDAEIARLNMDNHMLTVRATNGEKCADGRLARSEKAEAERDALRTLWTEARVVVAQCRDANCLASYGKAQCDAVAAANKWLDKMPSALRERRTIDDASNAEWELVRVTQERAQLRERTQWQCACGGTDCAGQAENERLRAEVERQTRETTKWAQSLLARTEAAEVRAARWKEQAKFSETQRTKLDGENDQLRARVAELGADKARLAELCSNQSSALKWYSELTTRRTVTDAEIDATFDAARAGKEAT